MSRIRKVMVMIASSRAADRALLQGIANYSRQHGSWSFYLEPGLSEKAWPMLKSMDLDGIILQNPATLEEIQPLRVPMIVVGSRQNEIPGVVNVVTRSEEHTSELQ